MTQSIRIESPDDPRIAPYRNLKDKELDRAGELFMAEGEYIVRRLLESDYPIASLLVSERRLKELAPLVPEGIPIYVGPQEIFRGLLGMKFQSGVMACGRRKPWRAIEEVIPQNAERLTLVVLPDVSNVQNVGSLIRIAAGFGADAMVLGEHCHDPFWRQSIRVSMGTIFRMPLYRSTNLLRDMERLKREWNVELAASVLLSDAEPLAAAKRPPRFGVLFGNEAQGLGKQYIAACDRRVTIPMKLGTDSLNVAIAAGIFLHHFTQEASFQT
jgi:tRNA G18 (ribose-2'-O)-methylase SpoU